MKKVKKTGYLWIAYLLFLAVLLLIFSSCATQKQNPADFRFKGETINPARNMKALKINPKKCN